MNNRLKALTLALAMCMALSLAVTPAMAVAVYTVEDGNGYVKLIGTNATSNNYTTYVTHPYALGLDADYWNMTVWTDQSVGISESTNATFYLHIHIYDGATNLTKNVTIAAKNDLKVYDNASHAAAAYAALVANTSAVYYVELLSAAGVVLADYHGEVSIYDSSLTASMMNVIMVIIPMIVLVMIIGWIGNLTGKIGGKGRRK